MIGSSEIFHAGERLAQSPEWGDFRAHYGPSATKYEILNNVYGGSDFDDLFEPTARIKLSATDDQLKNIRADLRIVNGNDHTRLELLDISLRQFLVSGFPSGSFGPTPTWDGHDHWYEMDAQYRLELCHSEISRWSLFFKKGDQLLGGLTDSDMPGHEAFSRIELVNNCTTTKGFELRLQLKKGPLFHGSFGELGGLGEIYTKLSQFQAGALAYQQDRAIRDAGDLRFGFRDPFRIYDNFSGWGPDDAKDPEATIPIDLERYRKGSVPEASATVPVKISVGRIPYTKWGKDSEYYQKAKMRMLMAGMTPPTLPVTTPPTPPKSYAQVRDAEEIRLPDFKPDGLYRIDLEKPMKGYRWLYQLEECHIRRMDNGRQELHLLRREAAGPFELRRIVFGNLNLDEIRQDGSWTLHRFGYGARDTSMDYKSDFQPPHLVQGPVHFAYLLAGTGRAEDADLYVCPEPYGIERAIFTWPDPKVPILTIDLMSFERILPIWQGRIHLPKEVL